MGKTLIIAEKPSVAGDIARALGGFHKGDGQYERGDAIVSNARGHLVEIFSKAAEEGGKSLNDLPLIPDRFELRPTADAGPQLRRLVSLMNDPAVTEVVNACDAGREGELIFRLIYDYAKCRKPMQRMWLQSMTDGAIREAWQGKRPGVEFDGLGHAARCRSEADWLLGINGSRGVTRLHERQNGAYESMAVGRVQTPTLAIVVKRENEIRHFVPKDYWEVRATFGVEAGKYVGKWFDQTTKVEAGDEHAEGDDEASSGQRIFDKAKADALVAKCRGVAPSKVTEHSTRSEQAPPRLFDLTTLQREANKRFKLSAKKTLEIAQALYETHKVTTYPRTDSSALPEDYVPKAAELMGSFAGTAYAPFAQAVIDGDWVKPNKRIFDDSKISDHFAIIPTGTRPSGLSQDEQRIFDLVARRFIAAFYPNAVSLNTKRITEVAGEQFKSSGRVLVEPGWRAVMGEKAASGDSALCAYREGETVRNEGVDAVGLRTKPPARYTEATLLAAMEGAGKSIDDEELRAAMRERGLGTPATRAAIIEGLLSTGSASKPKQPYMVREGTEQHLVPTDKGLGLVAFLDGNGLSVLTSAQTTGEWETRLLDVEKGKLEHTSFMGGIGKVTRDMIDVLRGKAASMPEPTQRKFEVACPKCGGELRGNRKLECASGCGFSVWTSAAGRELSPAELKKLLTERTTGVLKGFKSSKGNKPFEAALVLKDDFTTGFQFEDKGLAADGGAGKALGAPCPKCGGELRYVGGNSPRYQCAAGDFKLWMTLADREFSEREAQELVRNGSLPAVSGFVSRAKKKKFAAGVKFTPDWERLEFVFESR